MRMNNVKAGALWPGFMVFALLGCGQIGESSPREQELVQVLQTGASWEAMDQAFRELQIIGTQQSIPVLAKYLEDERWSHLARIALEPMPYPAAGEVLRQALPRTEGDVRMGIIASIGFRQDENAVRPLEELLGGGDTPTIKAAALALGAIGTPAAADALRELLPHHDMSVRMVAAEASLAAADVLAGDGDLEAAAATYRTLQDTSWPEHIQLGAFNGLLTLPDGKANDRILEALRGKDSTRRSVAIAASAAIESPGLAAMLVEQLPRLPSAAQVQLIDVLAERGDSSAAPALVQAARGDDASIRAAAVEALGTLGNETVVEVLCDAVASGLTEAERLSAVSSLEILRGQGIDQALMTRMQQSEGETQARLLMILAQRKDPGLDAELLRKAEDPDPAVQRVALDVLRWSAGPEVLPELLAIHARADRRAHAGIGRAIIQISQKITPQDSQSAPVLAALAGLDDQMEYISLLRILGRIGDAPALNAVQRAIEDPDDNVGEAAFQALCGWPNLAGLDPLMKLIPSLDDSSQRTQAMRGAVRLAGLIEDLEDALASFRNLKTHAHRVPDKRILLGGLSRMADPGALELVETFLTDKAVEEEAEIAFLTIAREIQRSHAWESRIAVEHLLSVSRNPQIREEAQAVLDAFTGG